MNRNTTILKTLTALALALALTIAPAFANAQPIRNTGPHMRPNLFHDRSPQMHQQHNSIAHH